MHALWPGNDQMADCRLRSSAAGGLRYRGSLMQLTISSPSASEAVKLRWLLGWSVAVTLLIVQRPLASPDLWWNLACGREVVSGTLFPAHALLTLDLTHEADWCGGLPFYIAWTLGGINALAAIPLLAAALLVGFAARQIPTDRRRWLALIGLPLLLWTIRDGLEPGPPLFDLIGMLTLWQVVKSDLSARHRLAVVFLSFTLWASLGPRPIWGLLLLLLADRSPAPQGPFAARAALKRLRNDSPRTTEPGRFIVPLFLAALLGGMVTPRGLLTWRDSIILFAPSSFANLATYGEPTWYGSFQGPVWSVAELAFLLLWSIWTGRYLVRWSTAHRPGGDALPLEDFPPPLLQTARCAVPLLAALLCKANLPACGLWILLDLLRPDASPVPGLADVPRHRWRWIVAPLTASAIALLVIVDATGCGLPPYRRLGWGIAQELNPQLLDAQLLSVREGSVVGWSADARSAGIVAWLDGGVTLADHPQRALLGGRTQLHAALMKDLLGSHRAGYRRDDGTWGGWVRQLADWNVEQLFVPAEQLPLNRALLRTPWKPVDLDSPTIPYVSGHDPAFSQFILEAMQQQGFVEVGPWRPTAEIYAAAGWRTDFVALLGGGPDPAPAILQSQLFRSLDRPLAALRALLPVRQQTRHPQLRDEFRACQDDLIYQEWSLFGEASLFRRRIASTLNRDRPLADCPPWLTPNASDEADSTEAWTRCISLYRQGRLTEAVRELPQETFQQQYAAAMLWLELGDSHRAVELLDRLLSTSQERSLLIAAKYWRQELEPFAGR